MTSHVIKGLSLFLFIVTICTPAKPQDTVIYWKSDADAFPNQRLIQVEEGQNRELYILGKASDAAFNNPQAVFSRIQKDGGMLETQLLAKNNLYQLAGLVKLPNGNVRVMGTEINNQKLDPYIEDVDLAGTGVNQSAVMAMRHILVGDIEQIDAYTALVGQSMHGTSGLYNIQLIWTDLEGLGGQKKFKKIKSDFNEECTQLEVLTDKSVVVLAKRYNQDMTSWNSVIYRLNDAGDLLWTKEIDRSETEKFVAHSLAANAKGEVFYAAGFEFERSASCHSYLFKLDANGKIKKEEKLESFTVKGLEHLSGDRLLAFGADYQASAVYVVKKGKYVIFDEKLKQQLVREMGKFDAPDTQIASLAVSVKPASSDYLDAIELSDGRIVLVGRLYMPTDTDAPAVYTSGSTNRNLVVFLNADGTLRDMFGETNTTRK